MECCCYLRNVHDKVVDGKTAFERMYGWKFDGPSIGWEGLLVRIGHFGTLPSAAKDKSRVNISSERQQQFGKTTLKGIFMDFVLRVWRGWSGDLMTEHFEDLQESEASEIFVKRFKNHEVSAKKRMRISLCKRNSETS